jgi:diguanylate cyclase (GGDEF)-like protein
MSRMPRLRPVKSQELRLRSAVARVGVRRLSRLATIGLALCLLSLSVVTVGGAIDSLRTGDRARHEVDLGGAYGDVQSAVLLAIRAQRIAADTRTPEVVGQARADYGLALGQLADAIQRVRDLGGPQDRALASYITIEARRFDEVARPLITGRSRTPAGVRVPPSTAHAMDTLETLVTAAAEVHRGNATHAMAELAARQRGQVFVAAVLLAGSSGCLAACWLLLLLLQCDLRRQAAEQRQRADHDALTGLLNRGAFHTALTAAVADPRMREGVCVLMIDLNDFKPVNDTWGHEVGDEVLIAVADRLRQGLRAGDFAGRLGGDEFAVLLTGIGGREVSARVAWMRERLAEPYGAGSAMVRLSASIGCATSPVDGVTAAELLRCADGAMYQDKARAVTGGRSFPGAGPAAEAPPLVRFS